MGAPERSQEAAGGKKRIGTKVLGGREMMGFGVGLVGLKRKNGRKK